MPIQINNVPRRVVYAASGTGPYAFTFEILAAGDIAVYKDDTLLTITTDYTVTIASNGTGSVTLTATPTGATQIAIVGNRTIQRTTDFVTGGDFFANTLNEELDQQTIFNQQNAEGLARALSAPQTDPTNIDMTLPRATDRAGKYLAFDAVTGNPIAGEGRTEVSGVYAIRNEIQTVAGISSNVTTVANNDANVTTVAGSIAGVNSVAGNITNVNAVAGNATNINAVNSNKTNIDAVASNATNITAVAGNATNINAVNANKTNIDTVAGNNANVTTVAGSISNVNTTAADISNVNTAATNIANVNTVAGQITPANNVATVAGVASSIPTVAGIASNVTTVAGISSNVTTVAGVASNVTTVATNNANVTTVATNIANVNNVGSNIASVNTNAANISAIQGAAANAISVSSALAQVSTGKKDRFVGGVNYTINTTTSLTLTQTPAKTNFVYVFFDGVYQNSDKYTVSGATITFGAAIPAAVVEVAYDVAATLSEDAAWQLQDARLREAWRKEKSTTIAPTLLLDFSGDKRLDPRITFTRTTTATYYDGKTVAKAEENLLLQSQDFTNASWVNSNTSDSANTDTAPDGTSTADTITATAANGTILQTFTAVAGSYTFSVWLKRKTGTGDIQIAADSGTWTTKTITASWARYDVTQTLTAGSKTAGIRIVTNTDEVYAWGAQLEQRSFVTAYTATTTAPITNYIPALQTAAAGQARFDHNPTTGESLGLLIEEQRNNLMTYSSDYTNAVWTKTGISILANTVVSPDGTLNGSKLVESNGTSTRQNLSSNYTISPLGTYTFSIYAKAGERTRVGVWAGAGAAGYNIPDAYYAVYDLTTGTLVQSPSSGTPSISNVGNGWYRISITNTFNPDGREYVAIFNGTTSIYTGNGYSGIYVWGAQTEAGSFATSYIPTVASTVTRNADAASMTGANFSSWFRQDEGTVYTEIRPFALAATNGVTINDNSAGNRIRVTTNSTSDQSLITTGGTAQATLDGGTPAANTTMKLATAFKVNDFALSLNGGAVATDTSGTVPVVSQMQIGAETTTVGNLTLRKVAFYPSRLADATLVSLAT